MSSITATEAKNRFGQVVEMAMSEPVRVHKSGRDVVVIVSAEQFDDLVQRAGPPKARPEIEKFLSRSINRRRSLYEALAK